MNLLIKNLVLFLLFYGFLSSFSRAKTSYDCSDSAAACVRISGGSVEYLNPLYNTQAMTLGTVVENDLSVNVVVKDSTGGYDAWDVGKYGAGFVISTTGYTAPEGILLAESDGMPTQFFQPNSTDAEEAVFADPVEDKAGMAYLVLDVNGALKVDRQFVNHGETIIEPGGSFLMEGTPNPPIAYSDVFTIGASGGAKASLTVKETRLLFHTMILENAKLTFDFGMLNVPTVGVDKVIYMNGDVTLDIDDTDLRYDVIMSGMDIYIENDNNIIDFYHVSFLANHHDPSSYSSENTTNIYVNCDSYCNKNSITEDHPGSHWGTTDFTLQGVATFNIELHDQAWLAVEENLIIENSNLVVSADVGVFSFSFFLHEGYMYIDENSSFTYNGYNSAAGVLMLSGHIESEGKLEINLSDRYPAQIEGGTLSIKTVQDINFNLVSGQFIAQGELEILDGEVYFNATEESKIVFEGDRGIKGTEDGRLIINVADDTLVWFEGTTIDLDVKINQEVYTDTTKHTLLRFDKVETFLDDDLNYNYNVNVAVRNNDFSVKNLRGLTIVLVQIRNEGPVDDFQYIDEVTAKIEEAGDGLDGIDVGGGDGGDGGDGSVDTSLSVLIGYEGDTGGGDTGGTGEAGVGFIDYITIGDEGQQYAEFGIWSAGGGGGSTGELVYIRAQDQYGEEAGLLTLTTLENMNGYEVAVVFDNIVLSDTDTEPYRVTLFNLVINNSRTVEQLGQTLNSLNANITLSNVAYSTSILEMSDKKNAGLLLEGQRFATYAEVRNIANDEFGGNYLVFGAFLTLFESQRFRFGASGFFSPYKVHTLYDAEEESTNVGASLFGAIQIGSNGGALMFDASVMRSTINGFGLQTLTTVENIRQYNYETSSIGASVSYNFGYYFSQRMVVSAFAMKPSSYVETGSDLALHVTTPTYYNAFVGYYSKLINSATIIFEIGAKYYFKEGQIGGTAGFVNDPAKQEWAYQYVLLDSPVELSADLSYKIVENLEIRGSANTRGSYRNIGVYITYKRSIFVGDGEYEEDYAEAEEEEEFEEEEEEEISFSSIYSGNIGD